MTTPEESAKEYGFERKQLRKPIKCPWCEGVEEKPYSLTNSPKPAPGDGYICKCGRLSIWLGASELRKPTHSEAVEFFDTPLGRLIQLALYMDANKHAHR